MNTLREHLREMLLAIDLQMKIPNTKLSGGVWMDYGEYGCTLCAAGAWYAQHFGRQDISDLDELDSPIKDTMVVMNCLRRFNFDGAHYRLYGRHLELGVPAYLSMGNSLMMDAGWRGAMDALLIWLTEHNL